MSKTQSRDVPQATLDEASNLARIEEAADRYSLATIKALPRFQQALTLAKGVAELRRYLAPIMGQFLPLMNTKLGFKTDRVPPKDNPYPPEVVCDCLIEATLRGLRPIGNEFNIIAGSCYITKEGFTRLLSEFPGLTDLKLMPGVPKASQGGAVVPYRATWKLNGMADSIEREIPIRMNSGSGADQVLGKAERKIRAAIYGQITGSPQTGLDADVDDPPGDLRQQTRTDQLLDKLVGRAGNGPLEPPITAEQKAEVARLVAKLELTGDVIEERCKEFGASAATLTQKQAEELLGWLHGVEERTAIQQEG